MDSCNRRSFMRQCLIGTAALAVVVRAGAAGTTALPGPANDAGATCGNCKYYRAKEGDSAGGCSLLGGQRVSADNGCGSFAPRSAR